MAEPVVGVVRVTSFFAQAHFGWSETWWHDGAALDSFKAQLTTMLQARCTLLHTLVSVQGVRLSMEGNQRTGRLLLPGTTQFERDGAEITLPTRGLITPSPGSMTFDQVRACLQMELTAAKRKLGLRYLAGIPDQISLTEPGALDDVNPQSWWRAWRLWRETILKGGWKVKQQAKGGTVTELEIVKWRVQDSAPSLCGCVIANAPAIGVVPPGRVLVRAARMNAQGLRSPNGQWIVDEVEAGPGTGRSTLWLRGSEQLAVSAIKYPGLVRALSYIYTLPEEITPYYIGVHKRGGPFGVLRGRRRTPRYVLFSPPAG